MKSIARYHPILALFLIAGLVTCITSTTHAQHKANMGKLMWVTISGRISDGPQKLDFQPAMPERNLQAILQQIRHIPDDPATLGLVIYLNCADLNLNQARQLYDAILELRSRNRKVMVFSESYDLQTYAMACAADRIILQYKGSVTLQGLSTQELYLKDLLEKVGVQANMYQYGKYKGADEQMTRVGPSEAWNQNIDALLDDLYAQTLQMICHGRKKTVDQIEREMLQSWTLSDKQLLDAKMIDDLSVRTLVAVTGELFGMAFKWVNLFDEMQGQQQLPDNPLAILSMLLKRPDTHLAKRPSIAVLHLDGPIVMGNSNAQGPSMSLLGSEQTVGSHTVMQILRDITQDPNIKGVVIRVDSPGGSAMASEMIWQSIQLTTMSIPVYISVDHMAASGGYYLASAGNKIYALPSSILGSIGVIAGKVSLGGLYEKLGIHVTSRSRGPLGDMFNTAEPFTPQQQQILARSVQQIYAQFIDRIKTGREDKIQNIDAVAQGRLFTGRQCVKNGLADQLGNLNTAVTDLAKELNLPPGQYDILTFPQPLTLTEFVDGMFDKLQVRSPDPSAGVPGLNMLAAIDPQLQQQAGRMLNAITLLRSEPVLTLMPAVITIR